MIKTFGEPIGESGARGGGGVKRGKGGGGGFEPGACRLPAEAAQGAAEATAGAVAVRRLKRDQLR